LHNILLTNNSNARRSISDTVVTRYSASPSTHYYDNKNTTFMMINRSGGSTVKKIIPTILERCDAVQSQSNHLYNCAESTTATPMDTTEDSGALKQTVEPPEEECYLLAQWAVDSYYKVVIAGNGGIFALIRAMQAFPSCQGLQECCCTALGNLCASSECNQKAVDTAGGIRQIVAAMKLHSQSVAVQSAACEALRNMSSSVQKQVEESTTVTCELIDVLQHAKEMYLHPNHRRTAEQLLAVTVMNSVATVRR
jgi:Armadillo/beta-catenin-like repeat